MRLLRYIALLLLVALSFNVAAQNKKIKVRIVYEMGDKAAKSNYIDAFRSTEIYTFRSYNDAKSALDFLLRHKEEGGAKVSKDLYMVKENVTYNEDNAKVEYKGDNDSIKTITLDFPIDYSDEIAAIMVYSGRGIPENPYTGEIIYGDVTENDGSVTKGVYSTFIRSRGAFASGVATFEIAHDEIQQVITNVKLPPKPLPPVPAEKPGILIMDKTFALPFRVKPNQRIVAQPVWYDRVDISDANCDTVFAYGKAVFLDCDDYNLTQKRHMDYKLSNDKLYQYADTAKYYNKAAINEYRLDSIFNIVSEKLRNTSVVPAYNDELLRVFPEDKEVFSRAKWLDKLNDPANLATLKSEYLAYITADTAESSKDLLYLLTDSIHTRLRLSAGRDTIFVDAYEELRGHDPNTAHPYPQGILVAVEDYNTIILDSLVRDGGERRDSWKFLDFTFREFLPDAQKFYVRQVAKQYDKDDELKLNFKLASDQLVENDSMNIEQLRKLELTFAGITSKDSRRSIKRIEITGQSSPEGSISSNLNWASRRAVKAQQIIRQYIGNQGNSYIEPPKVAPWSEVVKLLRADGRDDIADDIQSIIDNNPNADTQAQGRIIASRPYYANKGLEKYLAPLRTIYYKYTIFEEGQLPDEKIIEQYRKGLDSIADFSRAEFWVLLNRLKSAEEREQVARLALEMTRDTLDEVANRYNNGYWAYAAAYVAASNIAKGNYDLSLLGNFLNMDSIPIAEKEDTAYNYNEPAQFEYRNIRKSDFVRESDNVYKIVVESSDELGKKETLRLSAKDVDEIMGFMNRGLEPRNSAGYFISYPLLQSTADSVIIMSVSAGHYNINRTLQQPADTIIYKKGQHKWLPIEKKDLSSGNIRAYLNQPDMAANQLIMALKNPDPYWLPYMSLLEIIASQDKTGRYDTLVAVSSCKNGNFKGNDEASKKKRDIVASTSAKNRVILHIAMDEPNVPGGEDLDLAWSYSQDLPEDCSDSNYLRAIILNRKNTENPGDEQFSLTEAIGMLAKSFKQDIKKIYIASNDADLLSPYGEIVDFALSEWENTMTDEIEALGDTIEKTRTEIAFTNYKSALDELGKGVSAHNLDAATLTMYKSFMLDENYFDVLSVKMKGIQNRLSKSTSKVQDMFNALKEIRNSYSNAQALSSAGKPAGNDLYEQALREVQALKRDLK